MILRRLSVESWRCFVEPISLGPFGDGLNVVCGPNGAGKSTLLWALTRGLFDGHRVTGADIASLRPWGRELNPRVTVEFEHQGTAYRIEKQFLGSQRSELSRLEGGRFVPLAEGDAANERTRQMLAGDEPKRGVTRPEHWGFAQVLWATQGELRIHELSDGTRNTIQEALGAQVAGLDAGRIEEHIEDGYLGAFTPQGKLRGGREAPAVVGLERELAEAKAKKRALEARLAEFDEASRRIEDLRSRAVQAGRDEQSLDEEFQRVAKEAQGYAELIIKRESQQKTVDIEKQKHVQLQGVVDELRNTASDAASAAAKCAELDANIKSLGNEVTAKDREVQAAKSALDQARALQPEVAGTRERAALADRFVGAQRKRTEIQARRAKIEQVQERLDGLRSQRQGIVAPDAKRVQTIRKEWRALEQAQAKLDASCVTLSVFAESQLAFEILAADDAGPSTLSPGETSRVKGSPEAAIRVPGWGTIRATGPASSADQLRRECQEAREKLAASTAGFAAKSIEELEQLHLAASELDTGLAAAKNEMDALLADRRPEDLAIEERHAQQVIAEVLSVQPNWEHDLPDPQELLRKAQSRERQISQAVLDAQEQWSAQERQLQSLKSRQAEYASELKAGEVRVEMLNQRRAKLAADGRDDAQREAQRMSQALAWDAATALLALLDRELSRFGVDPKETARQLEGQLRTARRTAADAREKLAAEERLLADIIHEAPYSALAAAEEQIVRLEREIASQWLHINAQRLLYEVLVQRRQEISSAVLGPVERRASQTLHRIMGNRFRQVQLQDSFLPSGVMPLVQEERVAIDYLSGGEQEQVHFAVRLALAYAAFGDQRHLVVLDDPFTATDTARLARIVAILEEAAQRFQIVLLSCHPERYRHVPNARLFDLEEMTRSNGA